MIIKEYGWDEHFNRELQKLIMIPFTFTAGKSFGRLWTNVESYNR